MRFFTWPQRSIGPSKDQETPSNRGMAAATKLAEEIDLRQIDNFVAAAAQNCLERE